jgi:hypothetical protein
MVLIIVIPTPTASIIMDPTTVSAWMGLLETVITVKVGIRYVFFKLHTLIGGVSHKLFLITTNNKKY